MPDPVRTSPTARERADRARRMRQRFPAELQPHPGYRYHLSRVTPEGWVEVDAGMLVHLGAPLPSRGGGR